MRIERPVGVDHHRAQLPDAEGPAAAADTVLAIENRAAVPRHQQAEQQHHREHERGRQEDDQRVETALQETGVRATPSGARLPACIPPRLPAIEIREMHHEFTSAQHAIPADAPPASHGSERRPNQPRPGLSGTAISAVCLALPPIYDR